MYWSVVNCGSTIVVCLESNNAERLGVDASSVITGNNNGIAVGNPPSQSHNNLRTRGKSREGKGKDTKKGGNQLIISAISLLNRNRLVCITGTGNFGSSCCKSFR